MSKNELVRTVANAIGHQEGFFKEGSVAYRLNNPGNLRQWGGRPTLFGFVQFVTPQAGWIALESQIAKNVARELTFREFFAGKPGVYGGYSPGADGNDPIHYATQVCAACQARTTVPITIDTIISTLITQETTDAPTPSAT